MSGDDQNVNGSLRIEVVEGYDVVIAVDKISGDFSVSYLAENTIIHKFLLPPRDYGSILPHIA